MRTNVINPTGNLDRDVAHILNGGDIVLSADTEAIHLLTDGGDLDGQRYVGEVIAYAAMDGNEDPSQTFVRNGVRYEDDAPDAVAHFPINDRHSLINLYMSHGAALG